MKLVNIVRLVNNKLAGELLTYHELVPYLDQAIDGINTTLNTRYPAFSELEEDETEYNCFDDKYIRTVVAPGAAWAFYVADEEGLQTAAQYQIDYEQGKFNMLRDTLYDIPAEYQADYQQGSVVGAECSRTFGKRGLEYNLGGF